MTKRGALQKLWGPTPKELNVHSARWLINDDADFERFCLLTERKLKDGFKAAYFFPFLNVLHDNCTAGSGKKGLVGSSVRLINKRWELTIIPLLVAVHNGSQSSAKVKALITSRVEALYRVDIESMAQFTMSDTTPSALKVPKLENYETVHVLGPETNEQKKVQRLCTFYGLPVLSPIVDLTLA
ncbi:hypothetical protein PC116_g20206 [Phytophthora cactorum]|nr:hypothetical protein PC122_g15254 [Phytophthora cactorum]KAG4231528.1 hypothetical protein PC116_g20206 [Phytophthora cactorum]